MAQPMTVRLTDEQHQELAAVARVEGVPVAEVVREALTNHLQERRKDRAFKKRLQQILKEDQELLERLAK